jgi:hypothetical protein
VLDLPVLAPLVTTGAILRREALDLGLGAAEIERLHRSGAWVRIRPGAYADRSGWDLATVEQRHLIRAKAVLRALEQPAALAHVSAAVALGLPVWGADLSLVHVVRPARRHGSRVEAGVAHHAAQLPSEHLTLAEGVPVTSPARTVVDHSRSVPFESGVVTADAALHRGLVLPEQLREMLFWMSDWPGARAAGRTVAFSDGLAETVGESRGRVFFHVNGLPRPELQVEIRDGWGALLARVDFLFRRQRTIGEFDGRVKYRADTSGMPPEEVVWQEKIREDGLRSLGFEVVRFCWLDYGRPRPLVRRFHEAFARGLARPEV